VLFKCICWGFA